MSLLELGQVADGAGQRRRGSRRTGREVPRTRILNRIPGPATGRVPDLFLARQPELDLGLASSDLPTRDDTDCIFCRAEDADRNRILRAHGGKHGGKIYARFDNFPASDGHIELVPFRHVLSFFDLTNEEVKDLIALARECRDYLKELCRPDGYTIGVNDGAAAGQTVPHLHLHIIPRWYGDVPDPRGGIRQILPGPDPSAWLR
jgi:diadenosine tetraphosphate (Ap4A) HIT family hydrolase